MRFRLPALCKGALFIETVPYGFLDNSHKNETLGCFRPSLASRKNKVSKQCLKRQTYLCFETILQVQLAIRGNYPGLNIFPSKYYSKILLNYADSKFIFSKMDKRNAHFFYKKIIKVTVKKYDLLFQKTKINYSFYILFVLYNPCSLVAAATFLLK